MQHEIIDWAQNIFGLTVEVEQVQSAAKTIDAEATFAQAAKRTEEFLIQAGGDLDDALDAAVAAKDWQAAELLDIPIQVDASQRKAA